MKRSRPYRHVYQVVNGRWRWKLMAAGGACVAVSEHSFPSRSGAAAASNRCVFTMIESIHHPVRLDEPEPGPAIPTGRDRVAVSQPLAGGPVATRTGTAE